MLTTKGSVEFLYRGKGNLKESCLFLDMQMEGINGDRHAGMLRKADGRDKGIIRGTMIRNRRQWSAVSVEELDQIALSLKLENLHSMLLAPNFVVSGIPNFTQLPKGTLLKFPEVTLFVEAENDPCTKSGKALAAAHLHVTPHTFVKVAMHKQEPGWRREGTRDGSRW